MWIIAQTQSLIDKIPFLGHVLNTAVPNTHQPDDSAQTRNRNCAVGRTRND